MSHDHRVKSPKTSPEEEIQPGAGASKESNSSDSETEEFEQPEDTHWDSLPVAEGEDYSDSEKEEKEEKEQRPTKIIPNNPPSSNTTSFFSPNKSHSVQQHNISKSKPSDIFSLTIYSVLKQDVAALFAEQIQQCAKIMGLDIALTSDRDLNSLLTLYCAILQQYHTDLAPNPDAKAKTAQEIYDQYRNPSWPKTKSIIDILNSAIRSHERSPFSLGCRF